MYRGTFGRGDPEPAPLWGRWLDDSALRFGAKRVQPLAGWAHFTRRFVRGIFRHVHAVTKNDSDSFRRRRKPGRGFGPFLDFSQDGRGRCAARRGRGTGVPGGVPASVEGACCPARRGAALPAEGPLRRRDGGRARALRCAPRDEGRGSPVGCLLLLEVPTVRLATERHCRRKGRCGGGTGDGRRRFAARRGADCCYSEGRSGAVSPVLP